MSSCTDTLCYLERMGGTVTLGLVTIAGLVDGVNPCAIGLLLFMLGYLLVFKKREGEILKLGLLYIVTVYLTYLSLGGLFFVGIRWLAASPWTEWFEKIVGAGLILAGIRTLPLARTLIPAELRTSLARTLIPAELGRIGRIGLLGRIREGLKKRYWQKLIEKATAPAIIVLAVLVTLLETPCSLPLYLGTISVLGRELMVLGYLGTLGYLLYYNFLFVLPLLVILGLVWKMGSTRSLVEWQEEHKGLMKKAMGVVLLGFGIWLMR